MPRLPETSGTTHGFYLTFSPTSLATITREANKPAVGRRRPERGPRLKRLRRSGDKRSRLDVRAGECGDCTAGPATDRHPAHAELLKIIPCTIAIGAAYEPAAGRSHGVPTIKGLRSLHALSSTLNRLGKSPGEKRAAFC
jgi:hypothetical protein